MTDAATIVTTFIDRLCAKDIDGALALVTDDVEYDNVPMTKVFGPAGIRETLTPFLAGCTAVEWVIHHQAAQGDVVMNERVDRFEMKGREVAIQVAGVFEVNDEKITFWRDYFDNGMFMKALKGE